MKIDLSLFKTELSQKMRLPLATSTLLTLLLCGSVAADPLQCNFVGATCTVNNVLDAGHIKRQINVFQSELKIAGVNGRIGSCDTLLEERVGQETAHGAVCNVRNDSGIRQWIICDDERVGNLGLLLGEGLPSKVKRAKIAAFTRDHCLGA